MLINPTNSVTVFVVVQRSNREPPHMAAPALSPVNSLYILTSNGHPYTSELSLRRSHTTGESGFILGSD